MAVYVDDVRHSFGRMVMCHMWADTHEELLAMATRIGVSHRWLQGPPKASWVHFDIALSKKAIAIQNGAILTDRYGPTLFENTRRVAVLQEQIQTLQVSNETSEQKTEELDALQKRLKHCQGMIDTVHKIRNERMGKEVPETPAAGAKEDKKPSAQASFDL